MSTMTLQEIFEARFDAVRTNAVQTRLNIGTTDADHAIIDEFIERVMSADAALRVWSTLNLMVEFRVSQGDDDEAIRATMIDYLRRAILEFSVPRTTSPIAIHREILMQEAQKSALRFFEEGVR